MLRGPRPQATGQSRSGFPADDPQTHLEGENAGHVDTGIARLITNTPQRNDAEQRGDAAASTLGGMIASLVEVVVEGGQWRSQVGMVWFEMIDNPLENNTADVTEHSLQIEFELVGGGWCDETCLISENDLP